VNDRVWFTDRDLGKQFPRILAEAGLQVRCGASSRCWPFTRRR